MSSRPSLYATFHPDSIGFYTFAATRCALNAAMRTHAEETYEGLDGKPDEPREEVIAKMIAAERVVAFTLDNPDDAEVLLRNLLAARSVRTDPSLARVAAELACIQADAAVHPDPAPVEGLTLYTILSDVEDRHAVAISFSEPALRSAIVAYCERRMEEDLAKEGGAYNISSRGDEGVSDILAENIKHRLDGQLVRLSVASVDQAVLLTRLLRDIDEDEARIEVEEALKLCPAAVPAPEPSPGWPGLFVVMSQDEPLGAGTTAAVAREHARAREEEDSNSPENYAKAVAMHAVWYVAAETVDALNEWHNASYLHGWNEGIAELRAAPPAPPAGPDRPCVYVVLDENGLPSGAGSTPERAFAHGLEAARRVDATNEDLAETGSNLPEFRAGAAMACVSAASVDVLESTVEQWLHGDAIDGLDEAFAALRSGGGGVGVGVGVTEAPAQPFTYRLLQYMGERFIAPNDRGIEQEIRRFVTRYLTENDERATGVAPEAVPAEIEIDLSERLTDGVTVTVTADSELAAFRSWEQITDTNTDELPALLEWWRERFGIVTETDAVARYVEQRKADWEAILAEDEPEAPAAPPAPARQPDLEDLRWLKANAALRTHLDTTLSRVETIQLAEAVAAGGKLAAHPPEAVTVHVVGNSDGGDAVAFGIGRTAEEARADADALASEIDSRYPAPLRRSLLGYVLQAPSVDAARVAIVAWADNGPRSRAVREFERLFVTDDTDADVDLPGLDEHDDGAAAAEA